MGVYDTHRKRNRRDNNVRWSFATVLALLTAGTVLLHGCRAPQPKARIAAPSSGVAVSTMDLVSFQAEGEAANAASLAYTWEFGDGSTCPPCCGSGTRVAPNHFYRVAGDYRVQLVGDDGRSKSRPVSIGITVTTPMTEEAQAASGNDSSEDETGGALFAALGAYFGLPGGLLAEELRDVPFYRPDSHTTFEDVEERIERMLLETVEAILDGGANDEGDFDVLTQQAFDSIIDDEGTTARDAMTTDLDTAVERLGGLFCLSVAIRTGGLAVPLEEAARATIRRMLAGSSDQAIQRP